ncbi:hypothetical protein ACLKA7_002998 [Drosophila subpalustris]
MNALNDDCQLRVINISPTVQQLDQRSITLDNLSCLMPYTFPKMMSVKYTLERNEAQCNGIRFIELVAELFPGLESNEPYGVIDCVHLKNFTRLRKLDLRHSWIRWSYREYNSEIIGDLKSLEELIIPEQKTNNVHVIDVGPGTHLTNTIQVISQAKLPALQSLISLRQLTLLEDDGFTSEALQELITALPQLERLDLVNCQFWKVETELWETVACCPSLKILNISSMPLYADFFHTRSRRPMERVLEIRSTPLTLHCPDTGEYEHLINFYFKHRNLKLSFEPLKINYVPCNSVEMNLLPFGTSTYTEEAC